MKRERWWQDGLLVRELVEGVEVTESLGRSYEQLGVAELGAKLDQRSALMPVAGRGEADDPRVIANALGAAFRLAKAAATGEKVRASDTEIERRLAICKTCEHFVDNPMKCRKCGCYLSLKTRLETEHCPIGKW